VSNETLPIEAELAALRIILSNVVAQLAVAHASDPMERRARLSEMSDECKLAAQRMITSHSGPDRQAFQDRTFDAVDTFFRGITIT
jgi:hypothetical protein